MSEIETARLLLRPWRDSDAERLLDIHSRREIVQWLSDDFDEPHLMVDLEEARQRIAKHAEAFAHSPQGVWALDRRDGRPPAGGVILKTLPNAERGEVEIGWWLHPEATRRGYATEAATGVLRHGFDGGLAEIWAVMYVDNAPSGAVMARLGMVDQGVHERWYPGLSQVYRLTRQEWLQQRPIRDPREV